MVATLKQIKSEADRRLQLQLGEVRKLLQAIMMIPRLQTVALGFAQLHVRSLEAECIQPRATFVHRRREKSWLAPGSLQ